MFGWHIYKIVGHSMEPALKAGSYVLVKRKSTYKINDIIIFQFPDQHINIKRIKRIQSEQYYVTGDNLNDSYDSRDFGLVPLEKIWGTVIWH